MSKVSLPNPGSAGKIFIPIDNLIDPPASMVRLEVYENHGGAYVGISRLRIFAKEDRRLITPRIRENLSKQKGIWCLRVSK